MYYSSKISENGGSHQLFRQRHKSQVILISAPNVDTVTIPCRALYFLSCQCKLSFVYVHVHYAFSISGFEIHRHLTVIDVNCGCASEVQLAPTCSNLLQPTAPTRNNVATTTYHKSHQPLPALLVNILSPALHGRAIRTSHIVRCQGVE